MGQLHFVTDPETWRQALARLPRPHVLQSWAWGDFKARWGWQVERLLWGDASGGPVAAAQVLHRPIPGTPWRFLYSSKGPVLDFADRPTVERVLADLEDYARKSRGLFIKIDPDVARCWGDPTTKPAADPTGQFWLDRLTYRGWRYSPEQIQFRNTFLLDLTPPTHNLLAGMKSKWRYNIKLATRKDVVVRPGTQADLALFYQLYAETAARDGFLIRPEAYYHDVWGHFLANDQAELLLAIVEDQPVAGLILFIYEDTAWYLYGASTGQHRQLMPNHLLQWQAICRAKARGCTRYDFWGAPDTFDESDRLWGVYRFKRGFGGQVLHGLGAFDYPVNPLLYRVFTTGLPRLRTLWRRLKHRRISQRK